MRLALVTNEKSGTATDGGAVADLLRASGTTVDVFAIGDLEAVREAPADRLVVAGGDGSVGPVAQIAAARGLPLAVVASGTANDFARALGLPRDTEAACALARDPGAATRHHELARVGDRPFVNAASMGLSVVAAERARAFKSALGPLAYAVGALRAGLTASPLRCTVRCDGEQRFSGAAWQVIVGVTGAFGGGAEIGGTEHDDGLLDAAVVPGGPRLALARRALGMRLGRLTVQDRVEHHRGRVVEIELSDEREFNVDGEVCRCVPARFELVPGGFEVVGPP